VVERGERRRREKLRREEKGERQGTWEQRGKIRRFGDEDFESVFYRHGTRNE
jgi:hypothetical protein